MKTQGGKRENAGRKKGEPTTTISTRIELKYAQGLKDIIQAYKNKIKALN